MFKFSFYSTCKHAKALKHHLHVFTLSADSEVKLKDYKDLGWVTSKYFLQIISRLLKINLGWPYILLLLVFFLELLDMIFQPC